MFSMTLLFGFRLFVLYYSQLDKEMGLEFVINDEIVSSKDKDGNVKKYQ